MGIHSLPARRWSRIGLVSLLGLTLVVVTVTASHARAGEPGQAVAAKKCKKHKRSAGVSKKRKCKKHRHVLPAPGPLVRATLSWSVPNEVDLHAFDASGNHTGWDFTISPQGVVNHIPNAHHSGDASGPSGGTEMFTDDIFVVGGLANREFSYIACLYSGPSSSYSATFTGVTKSGISSSLSLSGPGFHSVTTPGGPPLPPASSVC